MLKKVKETLSVIYVMVIIWVGYYYTFKWMLTGIWFVIDKIYDMILENRRHEVKFEEDYHTVSKELRERIKNAPKYSFRELDSLDEEIREV